MNNNNEFFEKNIVVIGASSGIGQSVAIYFLNCGANVILAGRDVETMNSLCIKYKFNNATIIRLDLGEDYNIDNFKSSVVERFQKIDILINCAGIKLDGDVEKTFPQDFDYSIDINLRSVFLILRIFESYFTKGASIINISCLYGTRPMYGVMSYAMSKAGLETLTKYAAADYASLGIRINAVTACPVETNSFGYIHLSENEINYFKKNMESNIPLGRIARPDDIVKVIIFLASKRSEKITGQIIKVDGGRSLTSSGYIHYRGIQNMNCRFEPDSVKLSTIVGEFFNRDKKMDLIEDPKELQKFVEDNISQSNFSTRLSDAHRNINANYKIVDANESLLKEKYLKGNSPNKLLDIKGSKQGKITYNEGVLPVQLFPDSKNSLMNSLPRKSNRDKEQNENNQDEVMKDELNSNDINDENNNILDGMRENNEY
jgi:NAD(P)-dependent dehydrogenase (short-subunit alcohol dehydrogenase family)